MMLADELLLLTLSPAEGRNMRNHPGIRAAVCGADLLDQWLIGGPLPGNVRRHISKHNFGSLEPALGRLAAAGRISTSAPMRVRGILGARYDTLHDVGTAAAIRGRLQAALAGPVLPAARDAALAVVVYQGRLWNLAALEARSTEDVTIFGRRQPAATPLKACAQALAEGRLPVDHAPPGPLTEIAKAIDWVYRHSSD
jgi:hypothetical protein